MRDRKEPGSSEDRGPLPEGAETGPRPRAGFRSAAAPWKTLSRQPRPQLKCPLPRHRALLASAGVNSSLPPEPPGVGPSSVESVLPGRNSPSGPPSQGPTPPRRTLLPGLSQPQWTPLPPPQAPTNPSGLPYQAPPSPSGLPSQPLPGLSQPQWTPPPGLSQPQWSASLALPQWTSLTGPAPGTSLSGRPSQGPHSVIRQGPCPAPDCPALTPPPSPTGTRPGPAP